MIERIHPATLQDIARRAGVHRSTVALALRDNPRIAHATREKIKAIAEAFGYRVNPLVAALMKSRRNGGEIKHATLAFVTNYPTRFGWRRTHHDRPDFFPGAVERAQKFGYNLEHFWLGEPGMTPARFSQILRTRDIHGLLIGRMPPGKESLELPWEDFSSVALGMTLRSPLLHHVTESHFDTARLVMEQCRQRGYRRVGLVFSEANDSPCVGDRWLGAYFLQQMKLPEADRVPLCPEAPTDEAIFREWFRREKPDALIVTHAAPVLRWLRGLGCDVPRDVGLAELQDTPESGVSGVYYNPAKVGALAVEMLVGLLHRNELGVPAHHHEVALAGEWREGTTLPSRVQRSMVEFWNDEPNKTGSLEYVG
ncbi:MAG: LacI family DNA-binding transcriptional regulator [Nibricoccus sp.]